MPFSQKSVQVPVLVAFALTTLLLVSANAAGDGNPPYPNETASMPTGTVHGLPPPMLNTPFYGAVSWDGEMVNNLAGGLETGTRFDSLLHAGLAVDSEAIGLPARGRLKISMVRIDSGRPSVNLVGDTQVVSNIAAPSATRIYEFWYRQDFARKQLQLRAGLIDFNQHFDILESASDLVNSSFGISPGISENMPAAIYPKPGFGAMALWRKDGEALRVGLFQGDPQRRESVFQSGRSIIVEWQPTGYRSTKNATRIKLGVWDCRCDVGEPGKRIRTRGLYGSLQFPIDPAPNMVLFVHVAGSPGPRSEAPFSAAFGVNMDSPIDGRSGDQLSLGVTRQDIRGHLAETALEATYDAQLNDAASIQPDFQYVINPAGKLPNSLVFLIRVHVEFTTHFQ